ncbi:MAG: putative phosphoribosyl transferase [Actinomycetia bacterium]|nr:putative phosphoribosyl transferase [Actinomycetes bacterium]
MLVQPLRGLGLTEPLVLALPRGGVPVAYEIARGLGAELDVFVVRKVGAPGHPEFGIGAISEGHDGVLLSTEADELGLQPSDIAAQAQLERVELQRRVERYRGGREPADVAGRDVVVVDDGLATGVSAEAALRVLRARGPRRLVLAVPVCAGDSARRIGALADDVVCLATPSDFRAVGLWYRDFEPTSDDEVERLLERARGTATRP